MNISEYIPAGIYLFKFDNENTRTVFEISNLTIEAAERNQWRCSVVFIGNFEHNSHLVLLYLTLTSNK